MPKSKKSDLTGVVMWAVIIALVAGMFWVAGFETLEKWRHPAQNGVPNVFQEDREYWSRVNSPIVAGNRLYLLFDALQLVKVYDLQGNYLYTVNMTNKNHHGISALYAKDDEMYFREQSELYCFKADQFVQRLTGDAAETMLETLRAEECRRTEDDAGNTYLLSGVDIVREAPDGEQTTILHRSPLLNIYQDYQIIFWAIAFAARRRRALRASLPTVGKCAKGKKMRAAQSEHHPPRFSAFLPGIAFSCEKICANCKNSLRRWEKAGEQTRRRE